MCNILSPILYDEFCLFAYLCRVTLLRIFFSALQQLSAGEMEVYIMASGCVIARVYPAAEGKTPTDLKSIIIRQW